MLASLVIFSVFNYGQRGFRMAAGRNDLQSDARSSLTRLKHDLEHSTLTGVSVDSGILRKVTVPLMAGPSVQPRHLVCMPALSDWNAPGNFHGTTGLPLWDRYILYHADLQTDKARLFRVELQVASFPGDSWAGFLTYAAGFLGNPPPGGATVGGGTVRGLRALAGNLLGFEVSKSTKNAVVVLRLWNRVKGPLEGSKLRDEILELRSRIAPNNRPH
ncbi:hypothetical protein IV102_06805 [bacterium]|nr:hypothetical protein [bacterium]